MYCKHGFILYFDIMGYKSIVNGSDNGSDERFKYILDLYPGWSREKVIYKKGG